MQLAVWDGNIANLQTIRLLTPDEIAYNEIGAKTFSEAQNRLKLLKILRLNYEAWLNYIKSLLRADIAIKDELIELDRHMMNFLASAYGLTEHFECSYKRKFRKDKIALQRYRDFYANLCDETWAVAFFTDYRGYAQHVELPIGSYNRQADLHRVEVTITHSAEALLRHTREWPRSKLSPENGTLDIIDLAQDYFERLSGAYGQFIAQAFFPDLEQIDAFYWNLTQEATKGNPKARMIFLTRREETKERAKVKFSISFKQPPNMVFEELGIEIDRSGQQPAGVVRETRGGSRAPQP